MDILNIISSINDTATIINFFDNLDNNKDRFIIISNVNNDEVMLNLYNRLKNLSEYENIYILLKMYRNCHSEITKNIIINKMNNKFFKELLNSNKKEIVKMIDERYINIPSINIDPNITFGIEIESYSFNSNLLINLDKILGNWDVKEEISIFKGVEITSPILHFNKKSLNELKYICDFLKSNSFQVNEECGGHLHFGFHYFQDYNELISLINIFANCEEIIYLISNKIGDVPRLGIMEYAKPISRVLATNMSNKKLNNKSLNELVMLLKEVLRYKSYSLNVKNIGNQNKNTIEFRVPNGEIDFDNLLDNIILYARLIMLAKNYQDNNIDYFLQCLQKDILSEEEKKEMLFDLLFEENKKLKSIFNNRYYTNSKNTFVKKYMKDNIAHFKI